MKNAKDGDSKTQLIINAISHKREVSRQNLISKSPYFPKLKNLDIAGQDTKIVKRKLRVSHTNKNESPK